MGSYWFADYIPSWANRWRPAPRPFIHRWHAPNCNYQFITCDFFFNIILDDLTCCLNLITYLSNHSKHGLFERRTTGKVGDISVHDIIIKLRKLQVLTNKLILFIKVLVTFLAIDTHHPLRTSFHYYCLCFFCRF